VSSINILFAGKPFERLLNIIEPALKGHEIRVAHDRELVDEIGWAEVVILRPIPFGEEQLSAAPRLVLAQQWGVGVEGLDVEACTRHGVMACNVPSRGTGNAEGVAEIAILHMMLQGRRYIRAQEKLKAGKMFTPPGAALWKKRACVIGLGNVGHCVAERLNGLGMEVVGVNRDISADYTDWNLHSIYPLDRITEAVKGCRFVIVCLALGPETAGLINEEVLYSMDRDAFLINVARGPIVERAAFEKALDEKWIAGAGLDVLWDEPPAPEDPVLTDPRITVTPHIGGVTDASMNGVLRFIAENIERVASGRMPDACLNPGPFLNDRK
jgi:phosphoglycerate dehydrogenase-like enzyme